MKILITGMNKNQTTKDFYLRQQLKVIPSHYSLIRCLEDMGHNVEQKFVKLGEDISGYDKVIVYLAAPSQLTTCAFYNGLYVIAKRNDCILAFDDWQIDDLYKGVINSKNDLYKKFVIRNSIEDISKIKKYEKEYLNGINVIEKQNNKLLISAFAGGDLTKLTNYNIDNVIRYNPNPYHLNIKHKCDFDKKKRMFNFVSLVQSRTEKWLKKQQINKWEVEYFGNKSKKQRRLIESEMCKIYAEQWGCLMPGYYNAGSGWWRARPLQVADAESILIGDKNELMIYYNDYILSNISANDLEDLSVKELTEIALKQKEAIYKNHPLNKKVQQLELSKIFI